jgi:probable rRNA maturation factor
LVAGGSQTTEIGLSFVSDEEMRELNSSYRGKDKPTDVLSFSQEEGEFFPVGEADVLTLGDIVISVETARRQAAERQHTLEQEVSFLCVHGLLHLRGYDHMTATQRRAMWKQQDAVMEQIAAQTGNPPNSRKS